MNPSETRIMLHVLAQLSLLPRCTFWRCNTGVAADKTGRRIRFGVPGQPDIQGCAAGRWVGVEVKSATGRQSSEQRAFQDRIQNAGGVYLVVRSADEAVAAVKVLL